jgi:hypothetical protein
VENHVPIISTVEVEVEVVFVVAVVCNKKIFHLKI